MASVTSILDGGYDIRDQLGTSWHSGLFLVDCCLTALLTHATRLASCSPQSRVCSQNRIKESRTRSINLLFGLYNLKIESYLQMQFTSTGFFAFLTTSFTSPRKPWPRQSMRETPLAFANYFLEHFCSARLRNLSRWWQTYSDQNSADLVLVIAKLFRKYNPLEAQFPEKVGIKAVSKHTAYHRPSDFYSGPAIHFGSSSSVSLLLRKVVSAPKEYLPKGLLTI